MWKAFENDGFKMLLVKLRVQDTDEEGRKSNRNVFIGLGILVTAYLVIACLFCVENVMARIDFDVSGNATLNITLPAFRYVRWVASTKSASF